MSTELVTSDRASQQVFWAYQAQVLVHQQLQLIQRHGQFTAEHMGLGAVDIKHHHQLHSEGLLIDFL